MRRRGSKQARSEPSRYRSGHIYIILLWTCQSLAVNRSNTLPSNLCKAPKPPHAQCISSTSPPWLFWPALPMRRFALWQVSLALRRDVVETPCVVRMYEEKNPHFCHYLKTSLLISLPFPQVGQNACCAFPGISFGSATIVNPNPDRLDEINGAIPQAGTSGDQCGPIVATGRGGDVSLFLMYTSAEDNVRRELKHRSASPVVRMASVHSVGPE